MTGLDDIIRALPMDQLARQLGTDEATAAQAASMALPALLGGMQANAADPQGAASLQNAIGQHDDDLFGERVDLDRVDTRDGEKISSHIFGSNEDQVVSALGGSGGAMGGDLIKKLLPMLAPIVLSYLAKQMQGGGGIGGAGRSVDSGPSLPTQTSGGGATTAPAATPASKAHAAGNPTRPTSAQNPLGPPSPPRNAKQGITKTAAFPAPTSSIGISTALSRMPKVLRRIAGVAFSPLSMKAGRSLA